MEHISSGSPHFGFSVLGTCPGQHGTAMEFENLEVSESLDAGNSAQLVAALIDLITSRRPDIASKKMIIDPEACNPEA